MIACKRGKVNCIKIGSLNRARSTNVIEMKAKGPKKIIPIQLEADTGANITVMRADMLEVMDWVKMEPTSMHIQGYS